MPWPPAVAAVRALCEPERGASTPTPRALSYHVSKQALPFSAYAFRGNARVRLAAPPTTAAGAAP